MKKLLIILGLLVISGAGAWAVTEIQTEEFSWRYKMTIAVDTPEGVKTGSAVREVIVRFVPQYFEGKIYDTKIERDFKGEAVVVDLGKRGVLFGLLRGVKTDAARLTYSIFKKPDDVERAAEYYAQLKNSKAVLEPKHYPLLVTFTDPNAPMSVEKAIEFKQEGRTKYDYIVVEDSFEKHFGKGVKLKEVTFEMTDEPVTWKVKKYLPWINELKGGYIDGGFTSKNAPYGLYGAEFSIGEEK